MNIRVKNTTAIYCPFCGSMFVEHGKPRTFKGEYMIVEQYDVVCRDCGAEGSIMEKWNKPEVEE